MISVIRHRFALFLLIKTPLVFAAVVFTTKAYAGTLINNGTTQIVFNLDNDILFGTDREYTAGSHFYWTENSIKLNEQIFSPLFKPLRPHFSPKSDQIDQLILATEIYTLRKKDGNQIEPLANTGWTYFAFRHIESYQKQQLGMELNLGWIGPGSGGEEIQNGVHKLIGNSNERGWNHQYPNQPTINFNLSIQSDISQLSNDSFHSFYTLSGQLGTLRTNLGGGLGIDYASNCSPNFFDNQLNTIKFGWGWGWFVYSTINVNYEIYNRITDGRLFTDDRPLVNRRKFFPLFDVGIGLTHNQFSVNYSTKSTPQYYDNQPEKRFRYSSLNFHWGF
ncbi:lipid A-modifier LpxR family protein [Hydrogenovibrio kuenenii]|uniref:lipid A-modifier LpxR family protein n=1 Tax=Hydrogenovibrio kuenenii TaxID=63658 RepID=UPI000466EF01|nr:lipid A-modifier LpxR family protein [Hydrogenovibrio kuenenii]